MWNILGMRMRHILLLTVTLLLIIPGALGATNSEEVKVYKGETLELGQYRFQYSDIEYAEETDPTLEVLRKEPGIKYGLISLRGDEIQNATNQTLTADPSLQFTVLERGRDISGETRGIYLSLRITSNRSIFSSASMDSTAPDRVIVEQGGQVSIPLTITNDGLRNQTFNLSSDLDLPVTFGFQDFNVSRVLVETGATQDLTATIDVPESATVGMHSGHLWANNTSSLKQAIDVEVRGVAAEREMNFDVQQLYAGINPGGSVQIPLNVMNRGQPPLNEVTVSASGPSDWTTEVRPEEIGELGQYDRQRSTLRIEAPQSVAPGDYFIEVSASSERTESSTERIRINVSRQSNMGPVGIALMVISLIALVAVYRTFRRR